MGTITQMTVFVWTLNVLIFMSQIAMIEINPASNIYYASDNSIMSKYSTGGSIFMPNSTQVQQELDVSSSSDISEGGTGIFFIDAIASVKAWIQDKIEYFIAIVMGPYNILNSIDALPKAYVGLISLIWYGVSLLLFILTIFGRNT